MKKNKSNDSVTKFIILFAAIGIGTFICNILERSEVNVWLARGIGALITVIAVFSCDFLIQALKDKKEK